MNKELLTSTAPTVRVSAAPHPFKSAVADFQFPAGGTIAEILELAQPDPILRRHAHIFVDDWLIPPRHWNTVRPKAGRLVSIRVVAEGGGKSPLRILLTIAILVAVVAFSGGLGAAVVGAETFAIAGTTISSSVVGSAIISVAGSLLINTIAPIRPPSIGGGSQNAEQSPSYFLDQARNRARLYSPVPVIFGKHRVVPPLGAQPITEIIGGDTYLRMIVVWGYGPLRVTNIRIGDTPIEEFDDVRIETREGRDNDADITLYPDDIDQQNFSIVLDHATSWVTRRSAVDADELSIDLSFPRGLASYDDKGKRVINSVYIEMQYRPAAGGAWRPVTSPNVDIDGNTPIQSGSFASDFLRAARYTWPRAWTVNSTIGRIRFSGKRTNPIRHGIRWLVPGRGQYDVRIRRVSSDETSDRKFSDSVWSALRTITDRPPIDFPKGLAVSAIDIRATGQLSGVVNEVTGTVESEALDWNGTSWERAYTSNPASMFRLALQHPARRIAALDSEVDLKVLESFHDFCRKNGYSFNYIQDTRRSVWAILSDISAVARASPQRVEDKWTVVVDDGEQEICQHLSPVNASGFEFSRSFAPAPHGLRVTFPNKDKDWNRDERIVYAKDYDDSNATLVITLNPVGITHAEHVWKFARFHLAQTLLRRSIWGCSVSFEYLVAHRGRRVSVQHDTLAVGLAGARISAIHNDTNGDVSSVEIHPEVQLPKDIAYAAKIRSVSNPNIIATLSNVGGEDTDPTDRIMFANALNETLEVGGLLSIGEVGRVFIDGLVVGVKPGKDLTARLEVVPYQESIYDAELGAVPIFDSRISASAGRLVLTVASVTSDASVVRLIGDVYESSIRVEILPVDIADAAVQCEIRPSDTEEHYRPAEIRFSTVDSIEIGDVEIDESYDLRLRWTVPDRQPGPWVIIHNQEVTGSAGPPAPINFLIDVLGDGTRRFRWLPPLIRSFAGVQLRYGEGQQDNFDAMTEIHKGIVTADHYETVEPQRAGSYRFGVRSIDTEGSTSDPVYIVADIGPTRSGDVLYWSCPSAEGWPGTRVNTNRTTDGLDALIGLATYAWTDIPTWAEWDSWAGGTGDDYQTSMSYSPPVVDLGQVIDITIQWQGDTEGTVRVDYRASVDGSDPSGAWAEVNSATPFAARKVQIRWTFTGDGTQLLFLDHLCFSLNAPSAIEYFRDVNTSNWQGSLATGRKIPTALERVTDIDLVLQNVGPGWSWEITSKSPATIRIYNGSGVAADAVVDAVVRGIRSSS